LAGKASRGGENFRGDRAGAPKPGAGGKIPSPLGGLAGREGACFGAAGPAQKKKPPGGACARLFLAISKRRRVGGGIFRGRERGKGFAKRGAGPTSSKNKGGMGVLVGETEKSGGPHKNLNTTQPPGGGERFSYRKWWGKTPIFPRPGGGGEGKQRGGGGGRGKGKKKKPGAGVWVMKTRTGGAPGRGQGGRNGMGPD